MVVFHVGPVVGYLPSSAGHAGLIPGGGTGIPHAAVQLRPCPATALSLCTLEPSCHN